MLIAVQIEPDSGLQSIEGAITEDADFRHLLQTSGPELELDLSKVTRINSCGVREWLNFVRALEEQGRRLVLWRCSSSVVGQLNLIYNFLGKNGEVRSVMAPYVCDACGHEEDRLVRLDGEFELSTLEDDVSCSKCQDAMEFADLPEYYLQFHTLRQ